MQEIPYCVGFWLLLLRKQVGNCFFVKGTQENLMKARDERVGLMNEVGNHLDFLALA